MTNHQDRSYTEHIDVRRLAPEQGCQFSTDRIREVACQRKGPPRGNPSRCCKYSALPGSRRLLWADTNDVIKQRDVPYWSTKWVSTRFNKLSTFFSAPTKGTLQGSNTPLPISSTIPWDYTRYPSAGNWDWTKSQPFLISCWRTVDSAPRERSPSYVNTVQPRIKAEPIG